MVRMLVSNSSASWAAVKPPGSWRAGRGWPAICRPGPRSGFPWAGDHSPSAVTQPVTGGWEGDPREGGLSMAWTNEEIEGIAADWFERGGARCPQCRGHLYVKEIKPAGRASVDLAIDCRRCGDTARWDNPQTDRLS